MTAWHEVERAEPGSPGACVRSGRQARACAVRRPQTKTIATVRADESPRISGIEVLSEDAELVCGSVAGARKNADLRRDRRGALHGPTIEPVKGEEAPWPGEAKISGRAVPGRHPAARSDGTGETGETTELAKRRALPRRCRHCGAHPPGRGRNAAGRRMVDARGRLAQGRAESEAECDRVGPGVRTRSSGRASGWRDNCVPPPGQLRLSTLPDPAEAPAWALPLRVHRALEVTKVGVKHDSGCGRMHFQKLHFVVRYS
jgi:hypothetical protein